MKKVISLLIVSTFIFGARNIDNLMYVNPGMAMQEIHKLIEKPHNVRATKINNSGKVISIHEHFLKKPSERRNVMIYFGAIFGILAGIEIDKKYTTEKNTLIGIGSVLFGVLYGIFWDNVVNKGEKFWFFYEDDRLVYFCKPGDWETTAPPTLRVQWQDLN